VVWCWSGVRPLHDDGAAAAQAVTRDYVLEVDEDGPPALSVFGGKITTARALAEEAMEKLAPLLGTEARQLTRSRRFPGATIGGFNRFMDQARRRWPFLGEARSLRMARAYGATLAEMLRGVRDEADLGEDLGGGLSEVEVRWMRDREWARTAEDVLWRRSKLGLHVPAGTAERVDRLLGEHAQL
jgi:glycerol-3-phosphate dehydrogenase